MNDKERISCLELLFISGLAALVIGSCNGRRPREERIEFLDSESSIEEPAPVSICESCGRVIEGPGPCPGPEGRLP
jgi:hypothetical protein